MILTVHVPGAPSYDIGDEIWQEPLADAIRSEADTIADHAGPELLPSPDQAHRDALRERIILDMTTALVRAGDRYRAPDGVLYSLTDHPALDPHDVKVGSTPWPTQNQTRSSKRSCGLRTSHPDRSSHAAPSSAGATAPRANR
jgi:hypothetical protein